MKRVALYMRVSTKHQKVDLQRDALHDYIKNAGHIVTKEYIDTGVSGAKKDRPELVQLLKDAHLHKFDIVLVWKFDRFARSLSHLLEALEQFNHLGIGFVSLTDQIDTGSPTGKALFTMMAVLSELERDLMRERIIAGMESARRRGVIVGRPQSDLKTISKIQQLAKTTKMSINVIHRSVGVKQISRASVGKVVKLERDLLPDH